MPTVYTGNGAANREIIIPPFNYAIIFGGTSGSMVEMLFVTTGGCLRIRSGSNITSSSGTKIKRLFDTDVKDWGFGISLGYAKLSIADPAYGNTSGYNYYVVCI